MNCLKRSKKESVSYKMSRIRAKKTGIEECMSNALQKGGLSGYRRNLRRVLGTPDFCWKNKKVAVFCDSSFWHGYKWPLEKKKIKVRKRFWFKKIKDNIQRDKVITARLKKEGWNVLRFWDFDIKNDTSACVKRIARVLL